MCEVLHPGSRFIVSAMVTVGAFRKPKGRYTQARRLIELYDRLHRGGVVQPATLAAEIGVAKRTVERDIEILRESFEGKLERCEQPEPGWRWVDRQNKWNAVRWQVLALAVGARMAAFLSGKRFDTHVMPVVQQLYASLPGTTGYRTRMLERKIHVVESGHKLYRDNPELQRRLSAMLDALLQDRPVELSYLSSSSRRRGTGPRAFRAHVLSVVLHRASVYFVADLLRADVPKPAPRRLLALDRITEARLVDDAPRLPYPRDFDAATFLSTAFGVWTGDQEHLVRIRIAAGFAHYVQERSWHATQRLETLADGSLLVEMRLGALQEVATWVLGMCPHAEVLDPPELRDQVRERLAESLALHG